jgi:HEAT repeat protein
MRMQIGLVLWLGLLACGGCSNQKSTDELIAGLKSGDEKEGVIAARTLPRGSSDAAKIVPALIEALKHKGQDVRRSSALKLGEFRELAKDAIPALQEAAEHDSDARVREAAGIAMSRIDPERFPSYSPVPALIEALKDRRSDMRLSAATRLGEFRERAKNAIPALQKAEHDSDARVREAAGTALSRIDPERFPSTPKAGRQ